jgi:hypothetical protein
MEKMIVTKFREILANAKEKHRLAEQQQQFLAQVRALSLKVDLDPTRRGGNLLLLRWYFGNAHQENIARMLDISQSRYSTIENGKSLLDDNDARKIERELELPLGWLDRDHSKVIFLSNEKWLLVQEAKESRPH